MLSAVIEIPSGVIRTSDNTKGLLISLAINVSVNIIRLLKIASFG